MTIISLLILSSKSIPITCLGKNIAGFFKYFSFASLQMVSLVSREQGHWRKKRFSPPDSGLPLCQLLQYVWSFHLYWEVSSTWPLPIAPAATIPSGSLVAACHPQWTSCDHSQHTALKPLCSGVLDWTLPHDSFSWQPLSSVVPLSACLPLDTSPGTSSTVFSRFQGVNPPVGGSTGFQKASPQSQQSRT